MGNFIDLTGMEFDRLKVIRADGTNSSGQVVWICKCKCGNTVRVDGASLRRGATRSCGCLLRDMHREGSIQKNTVHGDYGTSLYSVWATIKSKCNNPNAGDYNLFGGAGISYYPEWEKYEPFKEWALANGYSPELVVDRKDHAKDFTPDNTVFVDRKTRYSNTKRTHMLTYKGRTMSISEWPRISGIKSSTIRFRLKSGVPIGEAIFSTNNSRSGKRETIRDDQGFIVLSPIKGGYFDKVGGYFDE